VKEEEGQRQRAKERGEVKGRRETERQGGKERREEKEQ
jgi:hypothetical protein